jgi:predicted branched-subunit amino acid permease
MAGSTSNVDDPMTADALRRAIPLFIPAIPFALVLGVAITKSAMPTPIAWSTNLLVFAGAAQLATVSLAAPWWPPQR